MKRIFLIFFIILNLFSLYACNIYRYTGGELKIYSFPKELSVSETFEVSVRPLSQTNSSIVKCYKAYSHSGEMAFCTFDYNYESPIEIVIKINKTVQEASILPTSKGIDSTFTNNELRFVISEPSKLSVEFDGDFSFPLFIFANSIETEKYSEHDENVIYFAPGTHVLEQPLYVQNNQTVYLAPGALVYGRIESNNSQNIKICGRGILSGEKFSHGLQDYRPNLILFQNCKNISLSGFIVLDAPGWTIVPRNSKDITISDIKQISYNYNRDGFDIVSCENVLIEDVMVRNYDDNISIKNLGGSSKNIEVRNSVIWADCAHNLLIGPENKPINTGNVFEDITFKNIDILHNLESLSLFQGVMAIMCTDNSIIRNVLWEDIRIERSISGCIIKLFYTDMYAETTGTIIENITFRNIVSPRRSYCIIEGESLDKPIKNVILNNVVSGQEVLTPDSPFIKHKYTTFLYND